MSYSIAINEKYNSLEISFTDKPEETTRDILKSFGFRWNPKKSIWYGFAEIAQLESALSGKVAEVAKKVSKKSAKPATLYTAETLEAYKKGLVDVWGADSQLYKHCMSKLSNLCELSTGQIIEFEKMSIEKDFCFDDSYDYDGAQNMAQHARTSEDYFKAQNMKAINEKIENIKEYIEDIKKYGYGCHRVYLVGTHYISQSESNPLASLCAVRFSAYEDYKETTYKNYNTLTLEDAVKVLEVLEQEKEKHIKKVDTYLKKYGLTKVNSWTYWGER